MPQVSAVSGEIRKLWFGAGESSACNRKVAFYLSQSVNLNGSFTLRNAIYERVKLYKNKNNMGAFQQGERAVSLNLE